MTLTNLARAMCLALAISDIPAHGADFRAGAGKSEIQITADMWPLEGLTSQHDPLTVRVLLLEDNKVRTAIVVLEQPSVSDGTVNGVKASLTKLAGVSPNNAIVVGTHTTSAPHANLGSSDGRNTRPESPNDRPRGGPGVDGPAVGQGVGQRPGGPGAVAFSKALDAAITRAISQVDSSLQGAKVGFGVGTTDVNINRDLPTPKGWAFGSNSSAFSDKSLPVIRIDAADGKPIAVLMSVAVRSVVMDGSKDDLGNKAVTADLAGAAAHYVENWYGGNTVALFLMGAAVDQAPMLEANRTVLNPDGSLKRIDIHDAGFTLLALLGERLGSEIVQASEAIKATSTPTVQTERRTLKVPSQGRTGGPPSNAPVLSHTYVIGPDIDLPVVFMRIGDIALVGMQPELGSSVGARIKAQSPFPLTIVAVMVDGGAKYMVDAESYDHFTNEARGSQFARGAADVTVTGINDLLGKMKQTAQSTEAGDGVRSKEP